tara:strand:+ start:314 stop:1303 length:990 start_codon:yes stop_codon:yes gene_type:complete
MTSPSDGYNDDFLDSLKGGLIWVVLLLGLSGFIWQSYRLWQNQKLLEDLEGNVRTQVKTFNSSLGRSETRLLRKHKALNALIKQIPTDIRKDLETWKSEIKSLSRFRIENKTKKVVGKVTPRRPRRVRGRSSKLPEKPSESKTPVSNSKRCNWNYSDWRLDAEYSGDCDSGTFGYQLHQNFEGMLIEGSNLSGSPSYVRVWELDKKGKRIKPPLFVQEFSTIKALKSIEKFHWLAPHLDVGVSLSVGTSPEVLPTLGVSLSGYGATKDDLKWRFLRGGVEVNEEGVGVSLCPALYNVGKPLPLVSNIWVTACYGHKDTGKILIQLTGVL